MLFANLLEQISNREQEKRGLNFTELKNPESLRLLLQEERARSNRSRNEFSFVLFNMKPFSGDEKTASRFIHILLERIRAIDKAGWLDRDSIGIVLPATSSNGARILAEDILHLQSRPDLPVEYTIYTYPFNMYDE